MKNDLNLLTVFDAVLTEGSMSRAGVRLGMTQSAVSHAIDRLRRQVGDPLFRRSRYGVQPTPRALEMAQQVRPAIDQLKALMSERAKFDPTTIERTMQIHVPAGLDALIVPGLLAALEDAPAIKLEVLSARAAVVTDDLRYGVSSLAIDYEQVTKDGYRSELLFEEPFVLLARRGHPALREGMTSERYQTVEHVAVTWGRDRGVTPVSVAVQSLGVRRNVRLLVPTISSMLDVVESSDLVGSTWHRVAQKAAAERSLELHPCPFVIPPVPFYAVWHQSFGADPAHVWLRGKLREITRLL